MKLSRIAVAGASGIMGLGLIGVGAHAAFTQTVHVSQGITTGSITVVAHATGGPIGNNTTDSVSMSAATEPATFLIKHTLSFYNKGSLTAQVTSFATSVVSGDKTLAAHIHACVVFTTTTAHPGVTDVTAQGALSTSTVLGYTVKAAGTTALWKLDAHHGNAQGFTLYLYAGTQTALPHIVAGPQCTNNIPSLNNSTEGQGVTATLTVHAITSASA